MSTLFKLRGATLKASRRVYTADGYIITRRDYLLLKVISLIS